MIVCILKLSVTAPAAPPEYVLDTKISEQSVVLGEFCISPACEEFNEKNFVDDECVADVDKFHTYHPIHVQSQPLPIVAILIPYFVVGYPNQHTVAQYIPELFTAPSHCCITRALPVQVSARDIVIQL